MNQSQQTIVIIGGVAGGASAAARARRHSEKARIIIIEKGAYVSFANCGLPYHIGGEITERDDLLLQTPQSLEKLLRLEVLTNTEAIAIHRNQKSLEIKNLQSNEISTIGYDRLILAPGASPLRPPLPGIDDPRIHTLRTLGDMDRIKSYLKPDLRVLIIGAGFIGLEMAEQLAHQKAKVTLVEMQKQVLPQLDPEMAQHISEALREQKIELILGDGIASFADHENTLRCTLASGVTHDADLVILSIGVRPENQLAKNADLTLGKRGHIVVNTYQQTNDPHIYAVGDVCESYDPILGGVAAIPLGGPANRQGRTAADHIFLEETALPYAGSIGTAIVRVFSTVAGISGHSEARLRQLEIPYQTITVNGASHASYYPGAETITLKLLWHAENGRILGAQAVGKDGVDKRLDIIATAIKGRLTIDDLAHLELSYAPPFGSAKDIINIGGFAAGNVRDGMLKPVPDLASAGSQIIDVRPTASAEKSPVPGAKNIPLPQLRDRLHEIDPSQPVFTICQMGKTSYFAARILALNGFDAYSIQAGAHHQLKQLQDQS